MWYSIHTISLVFPIEPTAQDKIEALNYYNNLPTNLIPCQNCADSFALILEETPPNVESRAALVEWCWDVHNRVNLKLNKPSFSKEDFIKAYNITIENDQPIPSLMTQMAGRAIRAIYTQIY